MRKRLTESEPSDRTSTTAKEDPTRARSVKAIEETSHVTPLKDTEIPRKQSSTLPTEPQVRPSEQCPRPKAHWRMMRLTPAKLEDSTRVADEQEKTMLTPAGLLRCEE